MYTGKLKAPKNRSANAMLTTSNKYFLRIFLFFAKITMVSKFPTTTRINVSVKALHNAMPSPWVPSYTSFVSFRRLTLAEVDEDVLVILRWFWDNNEEARLQQMLCSFLLFTDQLRMQTLHCDTLLMTETADVLFSLLISLGRVPLIKKRLFGRGGGGGGDTSVNFYRVCTTGLSNYSVANYWHNRRHFLVMYYFIKLRLLSRSS